MSIFCVSHLDILQIRFVHVACSLGDEFLQGPDHKQCLVLLFFLVVVVVLRRPFTVEIHEQTVGKTTYSFT